MKTKQSHISPHRWKTDKNYPNLIKAEKRSVAITYRPTQTAFKDAAFIVKAVNNHQELLNLAELLVERLGDVADRKKYLKIIAKAKGE